MPVTEQNDMELSVTPWCSTHRSPMTELDENQYADVCEYETILLSAGMSSPEPCQHNGVAFIVAPKYQDLS